MTRKIILKNLNKIEKDMVFGPVISSLSPSQLLLKITKVTQNNTGMYTTESSQQTNKIPNNNLDVRFERAYQNHSNSPER